MSPKETVFEVGDYVLFDASLNPRRIYVVLEVMDTKPCKVRHLLSGDEYKSTMAPTWDHAVLYAKGCELAKALYE